MGTYVCANGKEGDNLSRHSIVKKLKGCYQSPGVEIVRALPQLPTKPSDSLGLVTPDSIRESGDHADVCWSPVSSLPRTLCFNSQQYGNLVHSNEGSPRTPKGLVFNPFAPGPDKLMLAPQCKKYLGDSQNKVMRQLNFEELLNFDNNVDHTDNTGSVSEDEMLFESLYKSLLEFITSKQTEGLQAKASTPLSDSDGYKTPSYAPRLSGVADTCPDAPRKPTALVETLCSFFLCILSCHRVLTVDLHIRNPMVIPHKEAMATCFLMSPPNIDAFPGIVFVFITSFPDCKSLISHPM